MVMMQNSMAKAEVADIVMWPDPRLSETCEDVEEIDEETIGTITTMIKTMHKNRGVGIAANQIGVMKRIVVIDLADRMNAPMALINPRIVSKYGEVETLQEKCLSAPGVSLKTKRHYKVRVTALDITGEPMEFEADAEMAACLQHEIDHIDGVMFFERAATESGASIARRKARSKRKRRLRKQGS